ncbi:MAG: AAA family ATPase, partial [Bacilli bacterium]
MYITREIEIEIKKSIENYSKPICILGARQVGKSTTVKHCIQDYDFVYVNMFDTYGINEVFNENSDVSVKRIVEGLELLLERRITNDTIIVMDEIQSNPSALASLKSFKEDGQYKVIALGSNFGSFLLKKSKYSFPVGQITKLNMYPKSISEYLTATGNDFLLEALKTSIEKFDISELLHDKLLSNFDKYIAIGGIPEVVSDYIRGEYIDNI